MLVTRNILPPIWGLKTPGLEWQQSPELQHCSWFPCVAFCPSPRPEGLGLVTNWAVPEGWPHRQRISERRCLFWHLNCDGCSGTHQQDGSDHTGIFPQATFICTKQKSHCKQMDSFVFKVVLWKYAKYWEYFGIISLFYYYFLLSCPVLKIISRMKQWTIVSHLFAYFR